MKGPLYTDVCYLCVWAEVVSLLLSTLRVRAWKGVSLLLGARHWRGAAGMSKVSRVAGVGRFSSVAGMDVVSGATGMGGVSGVARMGGVSI